MGACSAEVCRMASRVALLRGRTGPSMQDLGDNGELALTTHSSFPPTSPAAKLHCAIEFHPSPAFRRRVMLRKTPSAAPEKRQPSLKLLYTRFRHRLAVRVRTPTVEETRAKVKSPPPVKIPQEPPTFTSCAPLSPCCTPSHALHIHRHLPPQHDAHGFIEARIWRLMAPPAKYVPPWISKYFP